VAVYCIDHRVWDSGSEHWLLVGKYTFVTPLVETNSYWSKVCIRKATLRQNTCFKIDSFGGQFSNKQTKNSYNPVFFYSNITFVHTSSRDLKTSICFHAAQIPDE
jgi:hypothetical protein